MKNIFTLLALVVSVIITSCEELEGKWDLIEVDKQELSFGSDGGEQTVIVKNYSTWWINGGYESSRLVDGVIEYVNYVYPMSSDGEDVCTYDILDGGWYYVSVPLNGRNTAVVKVLGNTTGTARQANIIMTVGNIFVIISISQQ